MLSHTSIFQDENVLQTQTSTAKSAGTVTRRRALGDITNNGPQRQGLSGKDAGLGPTKGKIGLKQNSNTDSVTKPVKATTSAAAAAAAEAAPVAAAAGINRLYNDNDYTEVEFCYGKDLFGEDGRPYDAGLKLESMRKATTEAAMYYTSLAIDALGPNPNEQLEFDLDYIQMAPVTSNLNTGSSQSQTQQNASASTKAPQSVAVRAPNSVAPKVIRPVTAASSTTSIKPMGVLKPVITRSSSTLFKATTTTTATPTAFQTQTNSSALANFDIQLDLSDLALDDIEL